MPLLPAPHEGVNGILPVISLFSGSGGLDIGLELAGFQTVACIETDAHCRETLRFNRPEWLLMEDSVYSPEPGITIPCLPGDVRNVEAAEILKRTGLKKGECALVVGGAPCQPFSNIGKKLGRHDERNGDLFLEFVRLIKGIEPQGFIFENVTGITQTKHNYVIEYMLNSLAGLGYALNYNILNAANYGVPQKRERFFLIGLKGETPPAFPLPTHFKTDGKLWEAFLAETGLPALPQPPRWKSVGDAFSEIPATINNRPDYALMNISDKVVERMKLIKQGQNFKVLPENMRPDCWNNGKHQGQDTFGRLKEGEPSVTIRTSAYNPTKGMYIHPNENRGLNTMELAALQSFPPEWIFKCKKREKITLISSGKQIGNAVPPLLAKALGLALRKQLSENGNYLTNASNL